MIDFQQIQLDYAECYVDKSRIKFIEKYLSTFNATAGRLTPFNLFPRQKVFLHSLADNKASIAIKHRQCGITTVSSAWMTGQCVFADKESPETILCIANKLDQANEIVTKIRDFLLQVPRWFWGGEYFSPDPKSEKNTKDIFVKNSKSMLELFNGCKVYARSSGPNAARGISAVSILIFDEAAFIEEGLAAYSSAVAATASVPNSKIIMVSTPNGKDELYYNTYKQALSKENNYNAVEFKWYQDLRYNKNLSWFKKDEKSGETLWEVENVLDNSGTVKYDEEKWYNLEKNGWTPTSPWYVDMCKSFNNDSMKIAQELDVSFMGSANNVVDPASIEMQEKLNSRQPLEEFKDPMVEETWFWKMPIEGHKYILACLPEGELVLTQRGQINVENVLSTDKLITKEGFFTDILHRKYRNVYDEDVYDIKLHNILRSIRFTYNHPIWSSNDSEYKSFCSNNVRWRDYVHNFDFNNASTITDKTWLEIPNHYMINEKYIETFFCKWNNLINISSQKKIDEKIISMEEFWWFCGIWLAEGYVNKNRIITTHNKSELGIHERLCNFYKSLGRKSCITKSSINNSLKITNHSVQLSHFLNENFGKYAHGKYINEWIKYIPNKYKIKLIEGYLDGDGCYQKNVIVANSVSEKLLSDIQDILFSIGIVSSLRIKSNEHDEYWNKMKICHKKTKYELSIPKNYANKLYLLLDREVLDESKKNIFKSTTYFSDDLSKIYIKVKEVSHYKYSGKVYNFETVSDSHTFCCRGIATHNCDPSRGDASDRTAIEVIDVDGQDEQGLPIVEQVMEYLGKKLGDEIGALVVRYAEMYNNAYVVVDSTGGVGDACLLTILQLGYKNIYYEDASQKTYTLQYASKPLFNDYQDKLPGFHFQGNRFPVLSNFAGMVRTNEFKIRSIRVINELETWIFKGDTGRMDHMTGAHDDSITCLAMGLFVMQFSFNKLSSVKHKDAAILGAYMMGGTMQVRKQADSVDMTPKRSLPMYNNKSLGKSSNIQGSFMWLFGSRK